MEPTIKKIYHQIVTYITTNRLFLSYVILALTSTILLRYYTIGNILRLNPLLVDLAFILILGSFGYLIKPKKQYVYFMIILLIITAINVVNCIYYTFYINFASIALLRALGQAGEVGDSIIEKLRYFHFIYLLMPIIFFLINRSLNKINYYFYIAKVEKGKQTMKTVFIIGIALIGLSALTLTKAAVVSITKQWNREYTVNRFGIILYQANDLIQSITPKINTLFGYDEAARNFRNYYGTKENVTSNNEYTNIFKDKNVIFVHMESIQNFVLDLKTNGKEVTPNLNKLKDESIYFNNFFPQIGVGTSSDTEFTILTSLMPALSGTVFINYTDRSYETTLNILKNQGYYTFSMHGNKASVWNRNVIHKTLGYDNFYSESSYEIDDIIGLGLSDMSFFKQIIPILEDIENAHDNYIGTIITLSNHSPFDDLEAYGEFDLTVKVSRTNEKTGETKIIDDTYLEDSKFGNYLKSTHYADQALGNFIKYINDSAAFNNTVFVFYGDHDARLNKSEFNNLYNYDVKTGELLEEDNPDYYDYDYYKQQLNRNTPLMIWTKDKSYITEYDYPMGMIDVMPTLANMMGFTCRYCLGNDIFTTKNNNTIVFPNGNYLTEKVYYNSVKEEYVSLTDAPIDENYINEHKIYADKILTVSNDIIVYDLIKKEQNNLLSYKEDK